MFIRTKLANSLWRFRYFPNKRSFREFSKIYFFPLCNLLGENVEQWGSEKWQLQIMRDKKNKVYFEQEFFASF